VLFYDDGVMHLFHSQQEAGKSEAGASIWYLNRTEDEPSGPGPYGWTKPVLIFGKPGSFPKNRLLKALSGDWLFPIYYSTDDVPNHSHIKTLAQGVSPAEPGIWGNIDFTDTDNLVQPSVVRPSPGGEALVAFFRDRNSENVYRATSDDDGETWSTPKAIDGVENPNSGIEAFTLDSGRIALV
jgi:predicted neuraminidase